MSWLYYPELLTAKAAFLLLTSLKVTGKENVPEQGPLLVVANHLSVADPVILGIELGRRVQFMAKEELFRSRLSAYFVRGFGSFPVYKGRLDREAIRQAKAVLAQGGALSMFPEGRRSKTGAMERAFNGSALFALRCNAPVLPVGIVGTERIKGIKWILSRPRLVVTIGKPFRLPSANCNLTRAELAEHRRLIMEHIAELLPAEYRGYYK